MPRGRRRPGSSRPPRPSSAAGRSGRPRRAPRPGRRPRGSRRPDTAGRLPSAAERVSTASVWQGSRASIGSEREPHLGLRGRIWIRRPYEPDPGNAGAGRSFLHHEHRASADVVVVGGGVIGLAVAWRAAARGLRVTLLERGSVGSGTSHGSRRACSRPSPRPILPSSRCWPWGSPPRAPTRRSWPSSPKRRRSIRATSAAGRSSPPVTPTRPRRSRGHSSCAWSSGSAARRLRASEARRLEPALAPTLRLALEFADDHVDRPARSDRGARRRRAPGGGADPRGSAGRRGRSAREDRVRGVRLAGRRADRGRAGRGRGGRLVRRAREACPATPGCRCIRSRARSCACTIRPARAAEPRSADGRRVRRAAR